jgi:hypothetical protein
MLTATFSGSVRGLDGQDIQGTTVCITALDQVNVTIGGESVELGSSVVDSEGGWTIPDMAVETYLGPLLRVDDCEGADDLLFPTHNWILPSRYRHLEDNESFEDIVLTGSHRSHIEILTYNLRIHNPTADIEEGGAMMGTIHQEDGTSVSGASISCVDGGTEAVYLTGPTESSDWLLDASGSLSMATGENGMFIVPRAAPSTYHITAEGLDYPGFMGGAEGRMGMVVIDAFPQTQR